MYDENKFIHILRLVRSRQFVLCNICRKSYKFPSRRWI
nr:MAG TPA: Kruppel-like factor 3 finger, kruppel-like, DNA BINDING [Caudoviricetes sp.]